MILSSKASSFDWKIVLLIIIAFVLLLTYLIFQGADNLTQRFGYTGLRIVQRIMGLILMVISVQFVIDGVTFIVIEWVKMANYYINHYKIANFCEKSNIFLILQQ